MSIHNTTKLEKDIIWNGCVMGVSSFSNVLNESKKCVSSY